MKAIDMYKALQAIVEREQDFSSDQNVMVSRLVADGLEATEQYGETSRYLAKPSGDSFTFVGK